MTCWDYVVAHAEDRAGEKYTCPKCGFKFKRTWKLSAWQRCFTAPNCNAYIELRGFKG